MISLVSVEFTESLIFSHFLQKTLISLSIWASLAFTVFVWLNQPRLLSNPELQIDHSSSLWQTCSTFLSLRNFYGLLMNLFRERMKEGEWSGFLSAVRPPERKQRGVSDQEMICYCDHWYTSIMTDYWSLVWPSCICVRCCTCNKTKTCTHSPLE